MSDSDFFVSRTGVRIAKDFRANLIIDRYDPMLASMRANKRKQLCSENSEDVLTWNVFRSLRQIDPNVWLPALWSKAFPEVLCPTADDTCITLWSSISPPQSLVNNGDDEGPSEVDVVIETPKWVWILEAKYQSDISAGTKRRPTRDQVLRNIDVGSYFAGVRSFRFSLLVVSEALSPLGVEAVRKYADLSIVRETLKQHRPDGLQNVASVGLLHWSEVAEALEHSERLAAWMDERRIAGAASQWLRSKLVHCEKTKPRDARRLVRRNLPRTPPG